MAYVTKQPRSILSTTGSHSSSPGSSTRGVELAEIMAKKAGKKEMGHIPGLECLETQTGVHIQQQLAMDIKGKVFYWV